MTINDLLDILFKDRKYVGAGFISRCARANGFCFPEDTIKRTVLYLDIIGKEIYWAGKFGKVYSKSEVEKILNYITNTTIKERKNNLDKKFPERLLRLKDIQSKNIGRYRAKVRSKYTSVRMLCKKYHLSTKSLRKIGKTLGLTYIDNFGFYNEDVPYIESYLSSLPSHPLRRSRLLARNTTKQKYGCDSYMQTDAGKKHTVQSRKIKCNEIRKQLERDLGFELVSSKQAELMVSRNNSTVISASKLLNLTRYKINGSFYYNKADIIKMDNFFKAKAGNKGQLARLFESELNEKGINYTAEKTFKDLRAKKPLRFDYYLNEYNCLIEVQGGQHFDPVAFNIGISKEQALNNFKELQKRDNMKREYCKKNNITLIEIIASDDFEKVWNYIKEKGKYNG